MKHDLKEHYLHSHLDSFTKYFSDMREGQGGRFCQGIKILGNRYQGRWDMHIMADYC